MLLRLDDVSLAYGSRPLLDHVSLQVAEQERVCLVGRNGEGKSSLLRLVLGDATPDEGLVWIRPGTRMAHLAQDIAAFGIQTVRQLVEEGFAAGGALAHEEDWQREQRVSEVLSRLQLDPDMRFDALSGGWRRRALLARALVIDPQILLLDEPTNHLDIEAIEWLEAAMLDYRGALLFVSHDRSFMNRLATRVVELDRGQLTSTDGNYDAYALLKAQQLHDEARRNALFDKHLAQEEVWIRKGVEARRTRNEGRVRALQALRVARRERRERVGRIALEQQETAESGALVFEAEQACISLGGRPVIAGFSARIMRGERIGIVGANGAGKSTLIRLLLGELEPDQGSIRRGSRLELAYYDQQRAQLQLDRSVMENVAGRNDQVIVNGRSRHVTGYLQDFLFRSDQLNTPAGALSGGERNRLLLARMFAHPANLLVLDEPTNDLDIDTLELLEEFVADFPGTLLLVSHDRSFLDNVVTSLLVLTGEGRVQDFVGGYSDLVRYRAGLQADAALAQAARAGKPRSSANGPAPARAAKPRRKLSYKDERELQGLPDRLQCLEAERQRLQRLLGDPAVYGGAHAQFATQLAALAGIESQIEAAYARWAELDSGGGT